METETVITVYKRFQTETVGALVDGNGTPMEIIGSMLLGFRVPADHMDLKRDQG